MFNLLDILSDTKPSCIHAVIRIFIKLYPTQARSSVLSTLTCLLVRIQNCKNGSMLCTFGNSNFCFHWTVDKRVVILRFIYWVLGSLLHFALKIQDNSHTTRMFRCVVSQRPMQFSLKVSKLKSKLTCLKQHLIIWKISFSCAFSIEWCSDGIMSITRTDWARLALWLGCSWCLSLIPRVYFYLKLNCAHQLGMYRISGIRPDISYPLSIPVS